MQSLAAWCVVRDADMATPDGSPVAWMIRRSAYVGQQRINGPDLMWRYCEQAQSRDESIFFYGSTEVTLATLKTKLLSAFPNLKIAGAISPPFRAHISEEDAAIVEQINASGAGVVWVSLGLPETRVMDGSASWPHQRGDGGSGCRIRLSRRHDQARAKVDAGRLHRLVSEPRRLWKRYLVTNTLFVVLATKQLIAGSMRQRKDSK